MTIVEGVGSVVAAPSWVDTEAVPAVRLRGVSKAFGGNEILRRVALDVPASEKVAIIGRSGSGKTTLLRILMTLTAPDSGTVEIFGRYLFSEHGDGRTAVPNGRELRDIRRDVGMVFQQFNLFPHMTAIGNVTEALVHVLHRDRKESSERGMELLSMVGLADKAKSYPAQLSGGQQQRVAIARALALEPRVMLFDEVTSALDPELVGEVLQVIRTLASRTKMTMLLVTHQIAFAREIADRMIFMESGCVEEDGLPQDLIANPKSDRTKAFLRSIREAGLT
jgi:polar amino acid transport system ATP-binding protein